MEWSETFQPLLPEHWWRRGAAEWVKHLMERFRPHTRTYMHTHTHTHTRTRTRHARTHARAHTHTHTLTRLLQRENGRDTGVWTLGGWVRPKPPIQKTPTKLCPVGHLGWSLVHPSPPRAPCVVCVCVSGVGGGGGVMCVMRCVCISMCACFRLGVCVLARAIR